MMTLKQVNELKTTGFDKAEKPQLNEALVTVNTNKNFLAGIEKDIKATLLNKMTVGEQLSLFAGIDKYNTEVTEKVSHSIKGTTRDLIDALEKLGIDNRYVEKSIKTKLLFEDYDKGKLPADINNLIEKTVQPTLKFGKK